MMGVIYILWLRQLKRYWRSKARVIGSLGQPVMFLLALGFGFSSIFQKAGEGNYLTFLVPGVIAMGVLFTAIFQGIELIWDKQFGFLKETLVAPVSRFKIMLGRALGGATVATIQGIIVLIISYLVGFRATSWIGFFFSILFMFLIALLFTSLGTALATMLNDMQGFQIIINFLVMPLFFLSGALFPLASVPEVFAFISSIDPLSYGVDGIRYALTGASYFGIGIDLSVLIIVSALFLGIGSYLFSRIQA